MLDGHTFANITEPNVLDRAGTLAVNALERVGANDGVAQGSAILEDENGVVRPGIGVRVARVATVELLVATIVGLA